MLKIRLSMGGAKKRPVYKIVVADSRFPRDGRFIEKVGFFNPLLPKTKKERVNLEVERIKYWISKGAKPTLRVSRILGEAEVYPMPPKGNNPLKAIPKKDRKKEKSEDEKPAAEGVKTEPKKEEPKKEAPKAVAPKAAAPKAAIQMGLPIITASAPSASIFRTSIPSLIPPSTRIFTRPATAFTISGNTSAVPGIVSITLPP